MWGIPCGPPVLVLEDRFIPTDVGNTYPTWSNDIGFSVHPHGCGEYRVAAAPHLFQFGSSPRMWGILEKLKTEKQSERFIPTDVGNT